MKCSHCGAEYEGNFCPECGASDRRSGRRPAPVPEHPVIFGAFSVSSALCAISKNAGTIVFAMAPAFFISHFTSMYNDREHHFVG